MNDAFVHGVAAFCDVWTTRLPPREHLDAGKRIGLLNGYRPLTTRKRNIAMLKLSTLWNFFDTFIFHSSLKRTVSSIFLLLAVQLAISTLNLFFFFDILNQAGAGLQPDAVSLSIRWCIIITIIGLLCVAVLCLCLKMMLGYLATKPLVEMDNLLKRLGDSYDDWSKEIDPLPYPELKHVSTGYNAFFDNIRKIIEEIRTAGIRIATGSIRVLKSINETSQKTDQQKDFSEQVSIASSDNAIALKDLAINTNLVSENTNENLSRARNSSEELDRVAEQIKSINQAVTSFGNTIDELNKNSESIMDIITLINDMSDQTHLLSLNATIEAARAGEHGKGFAVVAEEVRGLARQIKPATEEISVKIEAMIGTVDRTKKESGTIIDASRDVNAIIGQTSENFKTMIADFEETNDQLLKIAASTEELSLTNNEVDKSVSKINELSQEVFSNMEFSGKTVHELSEITEKMQEMVANFKTGQGVFDQVIGMVRQHRDHIEKTLQKMGKKGINIFDHNYKPVRNTNPQKFTTEFATALDNVLQSYLDKMLTEIPGCIYAIPIDKNGYLPTHHSHLSQPMTGNFEQDLLHSRDKRIYFENQTEIRRMTSTAPLLLQTYMRDTGEVLNDLSMPIFVDKKRWGAMVVGLKPEILMAKENRLN